jgi:tRNA modification GTPase
MKEETISAIATAPGDCSIAIVRLSGPDAISIANKIFSGDVASFASHTAHLGRIVDSDNATIDEVLLLVMAEGRSFTGEPSVEIMCHGGQFVTSKVLARTLEAGAIAAGPGEFSLRAYRNG